MKNILVIFFTATISLLGLSAQAAEVNPEALELIPPIAVEREDGLDKLPSQVFTDSTGLETWFVEERGFKAGNIATQNKTNTTKVERAPATKKSSSTNIKKQNTTNKKNSLTKSQPKVNSSMQRKPASKLPAKKKPGVKK